MTRSWTRAAKLAVGIAAAVPLTGCISVKAPDKPIDVNLNVNISQEVVVRSIGCPADDPEEPAGLPARADEAMKRIFLLGRCSDLSLPPRSRNRPLLPRRSRRGRSANGMTAIWDRGNQSPGFGVSSKHQYARRNLYTRLPTRGT